jgi:AcrR family transcriptional regulator
MAQDLQTMRENARRSQDRRSTRTRSAVILATREALRAGQTRPTVGELARMAGISRAAFYTHFASVDEAMLLTLRDAFSRVASIYDHAARRGDARGVKETVEELFRVIEVERDWLRPLLEGPNGGLVHQELVGGVALAMASTPAWRAALPPALNAEITARYLASASTGVLVAWLRGELTIEKAHLVDQLTSLMPSWMTPNAPHRSEDESASSASG